MHMITVTLPVRSRTVGGALYKQYVALGQSVQNGGSCTVIHTPRRALLSCRQNAAKDVVDLTPGGRLFQARVAATENARSPSVDRRIDGTKRVDMLADLRRRRASTSVVKCSDSARYGGAVP